MENNNSQRDNPSRDEADILRSYFASFSEKHLVITKGGPGTSLTSITFAFCEFLKSVNSPVSEVSNIQVGLLFKKANKPYIRRKTSKGAFYLVSVVTPIT